MGDQSVPSRVWTVPRRPIPVGYARAYLERTATLLWLLFANVTTLLVGVDFYVATMPGVTPFLWPFYADSPAALFLMTVSLATLLPNLGRSLDDAPQNRPLAYLHTFAFVGLLKSGLWTAVALNLHPGVYFPALWDYWAIMAVHLLFVVEAYLIPHYGTTTRGALLSALAVSLVDVVLDYGVGLHPPLEYSVGYVLPAATAAIAVVSVLAAWVAFDRLE